MNDDDQDTLPLKYIDKQNTNDLPPNSRGNCIKEASYKYKKIPDTINRNQLYGLKYQLIMTVLVSLLQQESTNMK